MSLRISSRIGSTTEVLNNKLDSSFIEAKNCCRTKEMGGVRG